MFPKAFIAGRRYVREQPLDNPAQRGAAFADYVAQKAVPAKGLIDAWISYNEPVAAKDYDGFRAWNLFQVAFAERLQRRHGVAAIAGNDAPGAIDINEYPQYFSDAIRASSYFGLHAYASLKSASLREPAADWYALRYRKVHNAMENAGLSGVPIVLTEVAVPDGWQGWKLSPEYTASDYLWLANEMQRNTYAIGYAAFGLFGDSGRWANFQLSNTKIPALLGR
jgi:hypothetical protein